MVTPYRRVRGKLVAEARRILGGPGMDWTLDAALARAAARQQVATIVDVGASNGIWARRARRYFPTARMLLIEAQRDPHEEGLRELVRSDPMVDYAIAAAGDREGQVHFDVTDPFGGAASRETFEHNDAVVPMTTIDLEVQRRNLPGPYLVKLDTHGFEPEILAGAVATLTETATLIIEAYNFELRPGVLRFPELCTLLEARGFRPIDLLDPMRRPKDGVLWQVDLVFAPASLRAFSDPTYG